MYKVVIIEDREDRYNKLADKVKGYPELLELVSSVKIIGFFKDFKAYVQAVARSDGDIFLVDWELIFGDNTFTPIHLIKEILGLRQRFKIQDKFWIFYSNSKELAWELPDFVETFFQIDSPNTWRPGYINLIRSQRYARRNYFDIGVKKAIDYLESINIPEWTSFIPNIEEGKKCVFKDFGGKFYHLECQASESTIRSLATNEERIIAFIMNGKQGVFVFVDQSNKVQFYFIRVNSKFTSFIKSVPFEKKQTGVYINNYFFEISRDYKLKSIYSSYVLRRSEILKFLSPFNKKYSGRYGFSTSTEDLEEINTVFGKLYNFGLTPTKYEYYEI